MRETTISKVLKLLKMTVKNKHRTGRPESLTGQSDHRLQRTVKSNRLSPGWATTIVSDQSQHRKHLLGFKRRSVNKDIGICRVKKKTRLPKMAQNTPIKSV